ncbi:cellulase family glycosylhydrolase [Bradyrhizobium ottawaense]|uniref:cellulase family glycosylhydrolase n=1 Tax=Bradyrhizobium ottawaense TaxID=931866 RepID=UPI0027145B70|nr:cellulase family glycosylhydrolase [Bradyrhizobium ottawaense]WLB47938.1 cellulase family glycosylhydrolase [Bradyrhizobium ottawaense]
MINHIRLQYRMLLIIAFALSWANGVGAATPSSSNLTRGVGVHLWASSKTEIDQTIEAAASGGFKIIRWDAPWKAVETTKGRLQVPPLWDYAVEAAHKHGLECLLILDYGNRFYDAGDKPLSKDAITAFTNYGAFLVSHFQGRVRYFEIWNEWDQANGYTSYGKPTDYVALVKSTYPALKQANPDAFVLVGAFSRITYYNLINFERRRNDFEQFVKSPGLSGYADGISLHPYLDVDPKADTPKKFDQFLTLIVQLVRRTPGLEEKPIFITEIGWNTSRNTKSGVTELEQTKFLAEALRATERLGLSAAFVYELRDGSDNISESGSNYGLLRHDWSAKPSYEMVRSLR